MDIEQFESRNSEDVKIAIFNFVDKNQHCAEFEILDANNGRSRIWTAVFKKLVEDNSTTVQEQCLNAIKILSRDKTDLERMITEERIIVLLEKAALGALIDDEIDAFKNFSVMVEALKALCNLARNSQKAQLLATKNGALEGVIRRLRMHADPNLPHSVKYFDMRLLFIISALSPNVRPILRNELHALTYLMEALDFILKEGGGYSCDNYLQYFPALDEDSVELSCEILKVMYNLTMKVLPMADEDEEEWSSERLIAILRELLLSSAAPHARDKLRSNVINLLTAVPVGCYEMLAPPHEDQEYNGEAIDAIVDFLDNKLSHEVDGKSFEVLSPSLMVLSEGSRAHKHIRKLARARILPPLRDVKSRPEVGHTLRNKLCRLLVNPNPQLRDAVAELLFVLCKENVNRMIKYTGFGNAAGMFAARGLMGTAVGNPDYSSDSENSDTEEYIELKNQINPVTGCYEPPRANPMESMTEEQKEYEVVKLVNAMDKLQREGIVQPCRIGEDGKPEPVEHILQLQEDLPQQQLK